MNYNIWNNFFNTLDKKYTYSIHIHDKNNGLNLRSRFKNKLIPEIIETKWGNVSLVKATLLLLKYGSMSFQHKKYVLLCGKSVPLVSSNNFFEKVLDDNFSWFDIKENKCIKRINGIKTLKLKNNYDKCSQWMILNHNFVKFLIKNKNNETKNFKCFAPDEHYFIIL